MEEEERYQLYATWVNAFRVRFLGRPAVRRSGRCDHL